MEGLEILFVCFLITIGGNIVHGCDTRLMEKMNVLEIFRNSDSKNIPPLDCSSEKIDAATMTEDKRTYFFKGDYYWRLIGNSVAPGYPRLIDVDWDGLPSNLDAAVTWPNGRTFFFKDSLYWGFHNRRMEAGYPKNISQGFCGIPNNLDAALVWKNGLTYFFKGEKYWRFDGGEKSPSVYEETSISLWRDLPGHLDAALKWSNGVTYFIKDGYYFSYNDNADKASTRTALDGNWGLNCQQLRELIPLNIA